MHDASQFKFHSTVFRVSFQGSFSPPTLVLFHSAPLTALVYLVLSDIAIAFLRSHPTLLSSYALCITPASALAPLHFHLHLHVSLT